MALTKNDIRDAFFDALQQLQQSGALNFGGNNQNNSNVNSSNSSFGGSSNITSTGVLKTNELFDTSLFDKYAEHLDALTEEIKDITNKLQEEENALSEAEKASKQLADAINSATTATSERERQVLENARSKKNLIDAEIALIKEEQKYRAQDNNLRAMEIKFRTDYLDRLKKHEKEEAILRDARGRVGMLGGKMGSFGEYLGNTLLKSKTMNVALEAFAKAGGGGKGVANAIGAGSLAGIGNALQGVGNFMNKDKVSITETAKPIADMASNFGPWGKAAGMAIQGIAMMVEEYDKLNVAAQAYVRNVGGGARNMSKMKVQASAIASEISKWGGMAYKMQDILKDMAELSEKTGRNFEYMSKEQYKSLEDMTKFGISKDVLSQYDTFGLSVDTIDKKIASIYSTSGKHGLNAKAVTDTVTKNLKMAQNYTFANGVRALEKMAERSVALKFNMDQAARFADKVSTLEGAVSAGAGLSVLGGDFAKMGNPLQMLYEGLNDTEGLMNRMIEMYSSMAKWDSQKGQFDITAYNRQRMKQAAQEMGVDYSEMTSMAMNLARENRVASQLGGGLDKDTETYIKNIATIDESGKAKVTFNAGQKNEETKLVSELTNEDKARLKNESEQKTLKENATTGDILVSTRTITDKLNDILDVLKSRIVNMMTKLVGGTDEEMAQNMGLNKANAELFEDISDDFYNRGITKNTAKILEQLGMSKEDIAEAEKGRKKGKFSQDEFDQKVIGLLNAAQAQGYTKANASNTIYKYDDNYWVKDDNEVDMSGKKLFANGGIVRGPGGPKDDLIPAKLSNGEYIVNAAAAAKNRGTLDAINAQGFANGGSVRPIKDQLKSLVVRAGGAIKDGISTVGDKISIEPININMNGTLTLSLNGQTANIDSKQLLDAISPQIIDYINDQLKSRQDFRLDRKTTHKKYSS